MVKIAIGVMSGTSLDGIDVAITKISGFDKSTKIELLYGNTIPFEETVKVKIEDAIANKNFNLEKLTSLHFELGEVFASAIKTTIKESNLNIEKIDFIASHGQTVWHNPIRTKDITPSTLQIGEGSIIAEHLKTTVISNFRAADIAAGGQGAPLVSYVDKLLFFKNNKNISLHNLGGISNLTLLTKDNTISYDTGPANMMINHAMRMLYDLEYDDKGLIARKGNNIQELYDYLMNFDYFSKAYPKTTGRELFGVHLTNEIIKKSNYQNKEDIITTLTLVTVDSIVNEYIKLEKEFGRIDEIIFSGGGVHNDFVLDKIQEKLPNSKVMKLEEYGMSSDYKEAMAFVVLGNQTMNLRPSNEPSATGAKKKAILGQINYYYNSEEENETI